MLACYTNLKQENYIYFCLHANFTNPNSNFLFKKTFLFHFSQNSPLNNSPWTRRKMSAPHVTAQSPLRQLSLESRRKFSLPFSDDDAPEFV